MGREVKRVPVDFDWPVNKVWSGFLMPERLREDDCPDCKNGYSPQAQNLFDLWYGYVPFDPASNGSTPLTPDTPAVRAFAERNVTSSPDYYGTDARAIEREAQRLAEMWNGQWSHHLNEDDVAALLEADRLWDLTRRVGPNGWEDIVPKPVPTPEQVNEWALCGFGHDSINASVVVRARCVREGVPEVCATCEGHAASEAFEGQRAEAEAWSPTEPPAGDGWQLWETVSEGSPISPVFPVAEGLAQWLTTDDACWGAMNVVVTVSGSGQRLILAAEKAIDGHHRAHLGEAKDVAAAVLRDLAEQFASYIDTDGERSHPMLGAATLTALADSIEKG